MSSPSRSRSGRRASVNLHFRSSLLHSLRRRPPPSRSRSGRRAFVNLHFRSSPLHSHLPPASSSTAAPPPLPPSQIQPTPTSSDPEQCVAVSPADPTHALPPSAQSQVLESSVEAEQVSHNSTPATAPISSAGGSDSNVATPIDPPTMDSGSATVVTVSPPTSSPVQRATHGTASDSLQDPVRAKFVTSPGYVVPAPSFSYSVFPRVNSATGIPQQTSSAPALKLTPPMSPAALQPPVPRQSLGNRPSFSYNIVPLPNAIPASGQQFQHTNATNQRQLLLGNPAAPPLSAACLQPPVPRLPIRPITSSSVAVPQNFPPSMQLPLLPPKGQPSPSTNFSFGGGSQSTTLETSVQNLSYSTCTSDTVSSDTSTTSATISSDSKLSHDKPASSSVGQTVPSISNSSSVLQPTGHFVTAQVPKFGSPTVNNPPRVSDSSALQLPTPTLLAAIRPILHNQVPAPLNHSSISIPTPQNVPQQIYPQFPSVPAMTPPQAHWLHPTQASGLQRPPFSQYQAVLPLPFPFPAKGMLPPSVPSPDTRPPGVSSEVTCEEVHAHEEVSTATIESHTPEINAGAGSLPPDDVEKEANVLQEGGDGKSEGSEAWTVHKTETGVIYYYNIISGESTYERPSNFKGEPEKTDVKIIPVTWEKLPGTNWTLVMTNDGKKYYYNTLNKVSSWQVPTEVLEMRKNQEMNPTKDEVASIPADKGTTSSCLSAPALLNGGRDSITLRTPSGQVSASALDLIKKKLQDSVMPTVSTPLQASGAPAASDLNGSRIDTSAKGQQPMDSKDRVKDANGDGNISDSSSDSDDAESGPTKEECVIQFKEMLKERGVAPFSKWDKELPKIVFDPRFKAVPSYSARRAIFEQYVRNRAEEERKERKAAQKAAINGFKQLLEEASEDIDIKTDFQTFKRKWGSDPRFVALDRKERVSLFNEKVIPLRKAAEEKIHAEREAAVGSFKAMLKDRPEITTISRWSKVKDFLRNDPRYRTVNHEEREALFNSYIAELKAAELEAERAAKAKKDEQDKLKEREREMRKRKEREEQEMGRIRLKVRRKEIITSYQALLVEIIKDPKASWTESKPKLEKDPQGRATNPDLNQSDAEKLFRDHVKDLNERCACDFRAMLAEILTLDAAARTIEDEKNIFNSWSEAKQVLKIDPRFSKIPRKDREALWLRYVEDLMRRKKVGSDTERRAGYRRKEQKPC